MEYENLIDFNPRECISGKMMRLNRVTATIFRKHLSSHGITDSQLTLLFILSKRSGLNQKQLCGIAKLEKSSLNRSLNRLFAAEYISKIQFPEISITPKGRQFVNDIIPVWKNAMNEIESLLDEEGIQALNVLTLKLNI